MTTYIRFIKFWIFFASNLSGGGGGEGTPPLSPKPALLFIPKKLSFKSCQNVYLWAANSKLTLFYCYKFLLFIHYLTNLHSCILDCSKFFQVLILKNALLTLYICHIFLRMFFYTKYKVNIFLVLAYFLGRSEEAKKSAQDQDKNQDQGHN